MSICKIFGRPAAGLVALAFAAGAVAAQPAPPPARQGMGQGMGPPASQAQKLHVLVWADVQSGFHHDSINRTMAAVDEMGRESGLWTTYIRTDSQMITFTPIVGKGARYQGRPINAHNLKDIDAIFFVGSGEGTLSDAQKKDLLEFVRSGKGFIGGHASTIGFFDWPEFGAMLGGFQAGEFRTEPHHLIIEDPAFPGAADFPTTFPEQYQYLDQSYKPGSVHVILRLDPASLTPEQRARRPDGDLPVVWTKDYGKGRVLVSTFGHDPDQWDKPAVRKLYFEGIKWALGLSDNYKPGNK